MDETLEEVVEEANSSSDDKIESGCKSVEKEKREFPCMHPGCGKKFGRPDRLKKHLLIHDNVRMFICGIVSCGKSYTTAQHLRRHNETTHLKSETNSSIVSCDDVLCDKTFQSKSGMRKHFKMIHQNPRYTCDKCSATFFYKAEYNEHMYEKHAMKALECEKCELVFTSASDRTRHMRGHRTWMCDQPECLGLTFEKYNDKRKHDSIVHPTVYICYHCNFQTQRKIFLTEHMYSKHLPTWERPLFSCSFVNCNRTFQTCRNYVNHFKRKHLQEQPRFICPMGCPELFATKQSCKRHVINMHTRKDGQTQVELPYSCDFCPKKFGKELNVRRHVNRIHLQVSQRKNNAIQKLVPSAFVTLERIQVQPEEEEGEEENINESIILGS